MVERLFLDAPPSATDVVLDPGCGPGAFIEGVLQWAERHRREAPRVVGVELDPARCAEASSRFQGRSNVEIVNADFLLGQMDVVPDYIIANPPYVPITQMDESEKQIFRAQFTSATGRFDLYMLFIERALSLLTKRGRLVVITPEKYGYVASATALRKHLAQYRIESLTFLPEDTFAGLITYPLVTTIQKTDSADATLVHSRLGDSHLVHLPNDGASWLPAMQAEQPLIDTRHWPTLDQFCKRISCGVATGADQVFVVKPGDVPNDARRFAWPTLAGRSLNHNETYIVPTHRMLVPYSRDGKLLPEAELGGLIQYLGTEARRTRLQERTCTRRKPWYAFHDSVPMPDMLCPKILCKDICETPSFWLDTKGNVIPRHTIYYIVPSHPGDLNQMMEYLSGEFARSWIQQNAQRAANGFIRMQSSILKQLPVDPTVAAGWQTSPENSTLDMRPATKTHPSYFLEASK